MSIIYLSKFFRVQNRVDEVNEQCDRHSAGYYESHKSSIYEPIFNKNNLFYNRTFKIPPTFSTCVKKEGRAILLLNCYAGVAQLVERQLPKLNVVSSSLITR